MENWGPLEVFLIIILVFAIASRFFGVSDLPKSENSNDNTAITKNCDVFVVEKPKSTDRYKRMSEGFTLTAKFNPCNSVFSDSFSLVVVDTRGSLVTSETPLLINTNSSPFSIHQFIPLEVAPGVGEGYVIITRFKSDGSQLSGGGQRIPVRFVN